MDNVLTLEAFTPRRMIKATFDMMQLSAEVVQLLMPGRESRAAWQEFKNKLQVFDLFENVDSALLLSAGDNLPLSELVRRASALEPYLAVWAKEGVGYYYAETCWEAQSRPHKLLQGESLAGVPAGSLAALHAGMGLSFAERLLKTLGPRSDEGALRAVLDDYVRLCRVNACAGYVGATYEALGLVARNLYPHLVGTIDRQLSVMGGNLREFFWHGVGRAIYFAPTNFIPFGGTSRRAIELAEREPPHELGRRNALAGVAWAITLVNIRQPEVVETLLGQRDDWSLVSDAFANGVISAVVVWRDSTGGDDSVNAFYRHQPAAFSPAVSDLWNKQVRLPCEAALNRYYGVLREHGGIGEVFRYQSLPALAERLANESRAGAANSPGVPRGVEERFPLPLPGGDQGKRNSKPAGGGLTNGTQRLLEDMIVRPLNAFLSSVEVLSRGAEGTQAVDGMVSWIVHTLSCPHASLHDFQCDAPARPEQDVRADGSHTAPDDERCIR